MWGNHWGTKLCKSLGLEIGTRKLCCAFLLSRTVTSVCQPASPGPAEHISMIRIKGGIAENTEIS